MLFNNLLIKRVERKQGVSESTGNEWQSIVVIFEFVDEFGKSYISALVTPDEWQALGYQEGQVVSLNLRFRTKPSFRGFVSTDIRIKNPQNIQ